MSVQAIPQYDAPINGPAFSKQLRDLRENTIRADERYQCFSRVMPMVNEFLNEANEAYERGDRQAGDLFMAQYQAAYAALKAINMPETL